MNYLKELKFPLTMSGMLFGLSLLISLRIDFYAVAILLPYLILGSIAEVGNRYLEITGQSDTTRTIFKMIFEPPAYFLLVLGIFYVIQGDMHWIFIGVSLFIAFIVFALAASDLVPAKEKIKSKNEINFL